MMLHRVEMALLLFALLLVATPTTEVDNLNILLPQLRDSSPALPLQLITAQGGCYTWTSSAPTVVSTSLLEGKGGCSRQTVVEVVRSGAYSSSIYITASDSVSDAQLNIPVRIRRLDKISIATKSRMMNINEIQKIELFAHDADLNTFTSLEGLRFAWKLEQQTKIIESVPLGQAQLYLPLRTRENLEREGFQSDILVVRALAPGNLKIIARCIEHGYEHLTDEITLSVHERFELKPGPILRMAASSGYQLYLERPTSERIILPQAYYTIRSCNGFEVNSSLSLTVGRGSSRCEIRVQDTRTIPPYSSNITVIVEDPSKINIISDPVIIVGRNSPFTVQFVNSRNQVLLGRPKELSIMSDFEVDTVWSTIKANRKSTGYIRAYLRQLSSQLQITALLPIRPLLPSAFLHLPVDETFKLRTVGGSGIYDYSVNSEVAAISSLGVVVSKQVGQTLITVSDRSHPANRVVIGLKVSAYATVRSLEQQKEVNREDWASFFLIGRNAVGETFTQCLHSTFLLSLPAHKLQIDKKVNFGEAIKFLSEQRSRLVQQALNQTALLKGKAQEIIDNLSGYVEAKQIEERQLRTYIYSLQNYGICEVIPFRSLVSLEERALIQLQNTDSPVNAKVPLRVYEPVNTCIKDEALNFLMTPFSSLTWNYTGGSYAWPSSETFVLINGVKQDNSKPIIACPNRQSSARGYELRIQNQQTKFLLFPAAQHGLINITCSFPKKLQLSLDHGDVFEQIYINPSTQVSGTVQPLDQLGNEFYNSSNVKYHYDAETGLIDGKDRAFRYTPNKKSDRVRIYCQSLKEGLTFKRAETIFTISVVEPFQIDHLLRNVSDITVEDHFRKTIQIITLYTPKKPYTLSLHNASPLLQIKCKGTVSCERLDDKLNVNLLSVGNGWVILRDKRIYGGIQWVFEFIVVEADEVVVTGDREFVPQGQNVNVYINNYFSGRLISPLLYEDNYLQLSIPRGLKLLQQHGNKFLIEATTVDSHKIYGQQGYPRTIRSKNPFVLNVYERIEPDILGAVSTKQGKLSIVEGETTVVIGCRRILRVKGGPKGMSLTFENDPSLTVKELPYNTFTIIGKKQGYNSLTFIAKNLEETIAIIRLRVRVGVVESVQLAGIDEPLTGAQFRLIPQFKVGESEIQGCVCDFEYKWKTDKRLVALGSSNSMGFLEGGGINATAIQQGTQVVSLVVEDKVTHKNIGQAQKYIKIINKLSLNLPTLIDHEATSTNTLRIAPSTAYSFGSRYKIQIKFDCNNEVLKYSSDSRIEAGKKVGHSMIKLSSDGFRDELIAVQVLHIAGILVRNNEGSLEVQPGSTLKAPLYLYDNSGRLFSTPMENLSIIAVSSNPDVLKVSISEDQKEVVLEGLTIGASVLTISIAERHVFDSISVSVGTQILPGAQVRVLPYGTVRYSLPSNSAGKWQSSDPKVAKIDVNTGIATALSVGKTQIRNGNTVGWLHVQEVNSVEQLNYNKVEEGYLAVYKIIWQGQRGKEEVPLLYSNKDAVNNNMQISCLSGQKWLEVRSQVRQQGGHQRLFCWIKLAPSSQNVPSSFDIYIVDKNHGQLAKFNYPSFSSGFSIDLNKKSITLSSIQPRQTFNIRTLSKVQIRTTSQNTRFVRTSFESGRSTQEVTVDMSGQKTDHSWQIEVVGENQTQVLKVNFRSVQQEGEQQHSFLSFSMDWPQYLIILMAIVFGVLCMIQYYSEEKMKRS